MWQHWCVGAETTDSTIGHETHPSPLVEHQDKAGKRRPTSDSRRTITTASLDEQQAVIALYEARRLKDAQVVAQRLTIHHPDDAFGWKVLGITQLECGQIQDSLSAFERSLALDPADAACLNSLGNALKMLGRLDEALDHYQHALAISPTFVEAHNNLGSTLQSLGRFDEALACLEQAVALNADFAEAWHNMANVLCDLGRHEDALDGFRRAIRLKPHLSGVEYGMGIALHALGHLDEALASFMRASQREPDSVDVLNHLGNLLRELGRHDEAIAYYRQALALAPEDALLHNNLGSVLRTLGHLDEALAHHLQALNINPQFAEAFNDTGLAMQDLGRLDEAETHYRQALVLNPDLAEAHGNLGNLWQEFGRFEEALACYLRVIAIKPHSPDAYNSMGLALMALGRLEEARACFEKALAIKPDHVYARIDLGNVLQHQGRLDDALACLDQALSLKPDQAVGWNNRGNVFRDLGRLDEALSSFNQAQHVKPNEAATLINRGNVLASLGRLDDALVDYASALAIDPNAAMALTNWLFALNYHPDKSAEDIFATYQDYDRRFGEPHRASWQAHANDRDPVRRLRIGYVSPDFRSHSSRHFLEPLLAHHDKSQVEVTAYAELSREDAVTVRYRRYIDHWVSTRGLSDADLAARIRADGIDILIDVAGHTANNRLGIFARRPAPVSVSWMGYGYTTGLSAIDYFLCDPVMVPEGSEHLFSEQPWRIDVPSLVYRPAEGMGEVGPLPALGRGYLAFGTLTRSVRINHRTIRVWSAILQQVPGSRLVVNSKDFTTTAMQQMLAERFAAHGIGPERLEIGCHSPPWDVLRGIDIGLDCFPHNSGTTLIESLYMGVPFVTLAERPSVGRIGSLMLAGAGHPEWIADSEDDYIAKAVALASDMERLATIRASLRDELERGPWRDEAGFARRVERAYREMWRRWCGIAPGPDGAFAPFGTF
ncbi:tetratricopeptide repeat protein [Allochromatium palmeri]|uniref:protein O-GlcNAc transferase n=2 Tax=Allochromatium palmeri TaxID=231048 RepID=A0A6N8EDG0_9GAMM|nr:tetratricopeptide repeat protein [Allochromatium palmeri]